MRRAQARPGLCSYVFYCVDCRRKEDRRMEKEATERKVTCHAHGFHMFVAVHANIANPTTWTAAEAVARALPDVRHVISPHHKHNCSHCGRCERDRSLGPRRLRLCASCAWNPALSVFEEPDPPRFAVCRSDATYAGMFRYSVGAVPLWRRFAQSHRWLIMGDVREVVRGNASRAAEAAERPVNSSVGVVPAVVDASAVHAGVGARRSMPDGGNASQSDAQVAYLTSDGTLAVPANTRPGAQPGSAYVMGDELAQGLQRRASIDADASGSCVTPRSGGSAAACVTGEASCSSDLSGTYLPASHGVYTDAVPDDTSTGSYLSDYHSNYVPANDPPITYLTDYHDDVTFDDDKGGDEAIASDLSGTYLPASHGVYTDAVPDDASTSSYLSDYHSNGMAANDPPTTYLTDYHDDGDGGDDDGADVPYGSGYHGGYVGSAPMHVQQSDASSAYASSYHVNDPSDGSESEDVGASFAACSSPPQQPLTLKDAPETSLVSSPPPSLSFLRFSGVTTDSSTAPCSTSTLSHKAPADQHEATTGIPWHASLSEFRDFLTDAVQCEEPAWCALLAEILRHPIEVGSPAEYHARSQRLIALTLLYEAFEAQALPFAQAVMSEIDLAPGARTIVPLDVGGIAGGVKFRRGSLFLKLAVDEHKVYGGHDEHSQKSASLELCGLRSYFSYIEDNPDSRLHVPLVTVVDWHGYRCMVSSVLPIHSMTLRYGSADGGRTVCDSDPALRAAMTAAGRALGMQAHMCGPPGMMHQLAAPCDIEAHRGTDGNYYVLDTARCTAPEAPSQALAVILIHPYDDDASLFHNAEGVASTPVEVEVNVRTWRAEVLRLISGSSRASAANVPGIRFAGGTLFSCDQGAFNARASALVGVPTFGLAVVVPGAFHGQRFTRLLRPEFQKGWEGGLSPDAFTAFGRHAAARHNTEVRRATRYLFDTVIPELADDLDTNRKVVLQSVELSSLLHQVGVNIRMLAVVRFTASSKRVRTLMATEMVSRTIKQHIRSQLRNCIGDESAARHIVARHLSLLLGTSNASVAYWDSVVNIMVRAKFGMYNVDMWPVSSSGMPWRTAIPRLVLFKSLLHGLQVTVQPEAELRIEKALSSGEDVTLHAADIEAFHCRAKRIIPRSKLLHLLQKRMQTRCHLVHKHHQQRVLIAELRAQHRELETAFGSSASSTIVIGVRLARELFAAMEGLEARQVLTRILTDSMGELPVQVSIVIKYMLALDYARGERYALAEACFLDAIKLLDDIGGSSVLDRSQQAAMEHPYRLLVLHKYSLMLHTCHRHHDIQPLCRTFVAMWTELRCNTMSPGVRQGLFGPLIPCMAMYLEQATSSHSLDSEVRRDKDDDGGAALAKRLDPTLNLDQLLEGSFVLLSRATTAPSLAPTNASPTPSTVPFTETQPLPWNNDKLSAAPNRIQPARRGSSGGQALVSPSGALSLLGLRLSAFVATDEWRVYGPTRPDDLDELHAYLYMPSVVLAEAEAGTRDPYGEHSLWVTVVLPKERRAIHVLRLYRLPLVAPGMQYVWEATHPDSAEMQFEVSVPHDMQWVRFAWPVLLASSAEARQRPGGDVCPVVEPGNELRLDADGIYVWQLEQVDGHGSRSFVARSAEVSILRQWSDLAGTGVCGTQFLPHSVNYHWCEVDGGPARCLWHYGPNGFPIVARNVSCWTSLQRSNCRHWWFGLGSRATELSVHGGAVVFGVDGDSLYWWGEGGLVAQSTSVHSVHAWVTPVVQSRRLHCRFHGANLVSTGIWAAVDNAGRLFTWGDNRGLNLGHPTNAGVTPVPRIVRQLEGSPVAKVCFHTRWTSVLTTRGQAYRWGHETTDRKEFAIPVDGFMVDGIRLVDLDGTLQEAYAVDNLGFVWCWTARNGPKLVHTLRHSFVLNVACGLYHVVLLDRAGAVMAFGDGSLGATGHHFCRSVWPEECYKGRSESQYGLRFVSLDMEPCVCVRAAGCASGALGESGSVYHWGNGIVLPRRVRMPWETVPHVHPMPHQFRMVPGLVIRDLHVGERGTCLTFWPSNERDPVTPSRRRPSTADSVQRDALVMEMPTVSLVNERESFREGDVVHGKVKVPLMWTGGRVQLWARACRTSVPIVTVDSPGLYEWAYTVPDVVSMESAGLSRIRLVLTQKYPEEEELSQSELIVSDPLLESKLWWPHEERWLDDSSEGNAVPYVWYRNRSQTFYWSMNPKLCREADVVLVKACDFTRTGDKVPVVVGFTHWPLASLGLGSMAREGTFNLTMDASYPSDVLRLAFVLKRAHLRVWGAVTPPFRANHSLQEDSRMQRTVLNASPNHQHGSTPLQQRRHALQKAKQLLLRQQSPSPSPSPSPSQPSPSHGESQRALLQCLAPVIHQPESIPVRWSVPPSRYHPADFIVVCRRDEAQTGPILGTCGQTGLEGEGKCACPGEVGVFVLAWKHLVPGQGPHQTMLVSEPFLVAPPRPVQAKKGASSKVQPDPPSKSPANTAAPTGARLAQWLGLLHGEVGLNAAEALPVAMTLSKGRIEPSQWLQLTESFLFDAGIELHCRERILVAVRKRLRALNDQ